MSTPLFFCVSWPGYLMMMFYIKDEDVLFFSLNNEWSFAGEGGDESHFYDGMWCVPFTVWFVNSEWVCL